jgi:PhnB protein
MAKKKKVSPIPKGYPVLSIHLSIKGAAEAIDFYKRAFGAKERLRIDGPGGSIGHAELMIGPALLMLADEFPGAGVSSPTTLNGATSTLMLYVKNVDAAHRKALEAGATAVFPPADKFYGDRTSAIRDPFGHVWSLATHVEDVPPKEMAKRAESEMAKMMAVKPQG